MQWRSFLTLFIGILIGASTGTAALGAAGILDIPGAVNAAFTSESVFTPQVGVKAAEIALEGLDGNRVRLSQFRPKPVLVNFWATWCPPCREEMPLLQAAADRYRNTLVVLGVNFDEPENEVQSFVKEFGITFPILLDPGGRIGDLYRVYAFPTSVFVDGTGVIQVVHIGQLREEDLNRYLSQLGVEP